MWQSKSLKLNDCKSVNFPLLGIYESLIFTKLSPACVCIVSGCLLLCLCIRPPADPLTLSRHSPHHAHHTNQLTPQSFTLAHFQPGFTTQMISPCFSSLLELLQQQNMICCMTRSTRMVLILSPWSPHPACGTK